MSAGRGDPCRMRAEVIANRRAGDYQHLTMVAPDIAEIARPGQFVAVSVGGPTSAHLLRRAFSIHKVTPSGTYGGTVEVVVAAHGPGTRWITQITVGGVLDVVGPLGRPFPQPTEQIAAVLVGGGYGSAPLFWLGAELRARGCSVEYVLGAATSERLFGVVEARRSGGGVTVTTDDGSAGSRGWVTDVVDEVIDRVDAQAVYACGPMPMLSALAGIGARHGVATFTAVEEAMACGVGICMTCVLPVRRADGTTAMVRSCTDGPVFRAERVRWDAMTDAGAAVPADCLGADAMGGH